MECKVLAFTRVPYGDTYFYKRGIIYEMDIGKQRMRRTFPYDGSDFYRQER